MKKRNVISKLSVSSFDACCNGHFLIEVLVAQWCNPLTLQPEQSGGVGSIPGRAPPLECRDHGRGSSIVKVPGDVPPARVYFFGLLV